jgi:capsid protein
MFDAAKWNRFTTDFLAPNTSADAELRGSLKVLRNRSRALVRDNPTPARPSAPPKST